MSKKAQANYRRRYPEKVKAYDAAYRQSLKELPKETQRAIKDAKNKTERERRLKLKVEDPEAYELFLLKRRAVRDKWWRSLSYEEREFQRELQRERKRRWCLRNIERKLGKDAFK